MKILHVIASLDRREGGPAVACLGMAALMARRGHDVRVLTLAPGFDPAVGALAPGVAIEALPLSPAAGLRVSWPLDRRLAAAVPAADIVHLHSLYLFHDWSAARHCRRHGKPYIVRPHGTLDPFIHRRHRWRKAVIDRLFQNDVLRRAAGLHYTTAEEWRLAAPHALNACGAVAPNGIDPAEFQNPPPRSALRQRYPQIGDRRVVLFLGRLNFKKGLEIAVDAFAEAARRRDDLFLVIAGPDDGMRGKIESRIRERGIEQMSLFTGMVSGADKAAVLTGSDVFLLPSLSENFAITVIEAAASGVPVIMSDRVNLCHEFAAAGAALIAEPNAASFAASLNALLDDPAAATRLRRRAAELVQARFAWDALGQVYEKMYATAIRDGALPVLTP
ncbi:MAG TPA: glycosyltransferase [Stellaceae bacterium]|nr:glycosyltransferase [Stellaceae bacterium]